LSIESVTDAESVGAAFVTSPASLLSLAAALLDAAIWSLIAVRVFSASAAA